MKKHVKTENYTMRPTKVALLIAATFAMVAVPANARLGETETEMAKRFGPPTHGKDGKFKYSKNGVSVLAVYFEGRCCTILYSQPDDFLPEQVEQFKASNLPAGQKWESALINPKRAGRMLALRTTDKSRECAGEGNSFYFSDRQASAKLKAAEEKERTADTSGF